MKTTIFMVVRNVSQKQELFSRVLAQVIKLKNIDFYVVNHGSTDNTKEYLESFHKKNSDITIQIINEKFEGTMDDTKARHYKHLLKSSTDLNSQFILLLDWDEVLDDNLVIEINNLDWSKDIYLINRHTYLIKNPIDRNSYLPLLFRIACVEVNTFSKFHNLYKIHSKNVAKLKGILHHYSYADIGELIQKSIYYSKGEADSLFEKNQNIGNTEIFFRLSFESCKYFIYMLLYHRNFLHLEGWFICISGVVYIFYKYLYYLELKLLISKRK